MKLNLVNSSLIFKTANIIEKSISKTFSVSDVGSEARVILNLDKAIAANVPFKLSIGGDHVVNSDTWNLYINEIQETTVTGLVEDKELTFTYPVYKITLQRGSLAAAGTVNLEVKYAFVEKTYPSLDSTLSLDSGVGDVVFTLPNAIDAPCYFELVGGARSGGINESTNLLIHFLDASNNEIGTAIQRALPTNTPTTVKCTGSTPVKYIKVDRANLGSITGTIDITLYYFPEGV